MSFRIVAVCMMAWFLATQTNAQFATVDQEESSLSFEVRSGDRVIIGVFGLWSADIEFDKDNLEAASFKVIAEISSISLSDEIAQAMVATTAWLAPNEFPLATFESETVTAFEENSYRVDGSLVLRGHTAPVELLIIIEDLSKTAVAAVMGQIDRTDFAIGSSFGPEIVGRLVTVNATVVFSQ
ncbi:MAG: YceI family protein [Pseudomonadota bacterium]